MKSENILRIKIIAGVILLIAFILIARLYNVQIMNGNKYSDRADRQYVRPNQSLFDRGKIFMKDKDDILVSGATLKTGFTVSINPSIVGNLDSIYLKLSEIIDLDPEEFLKKTEDKSDPYEELARRIDDEPAKKIADLNIKGISIYKDRWRFYPGNSLAAQTLGFVAFENEDSDISGVYGLERYYDDILSRNNDDTYVNFFAEVFANLNKTIFDGASHRAGDIVTTIDPSVQLFLERKLVEVDKSWDPRFTAGIIINPINGEIYAMAVNPTFDLNDFSGETDVSIFGNPLVEDVFEMGSIIKPLTMAAGIDAGAITSKSTYDDKGFVVIDGSKVSNYDDRGWGIMSMQEVINKSLNTGVAHVVSKMGNKKFADYMRSFGIGEETGVDLPNEGVGLISNLDSPRNLEYTTAAFGQGIALTPIATVRALSTLANGGVLVTPHFASEIKYKSGLSKKVSFNDGERVLKNETTEEVTRMLVNAVDDALLGGTVKLKNYSVAAKTGTAQIAKLSERGYYDDRYLHSFFGYFPAYDPQFLVFLLAVEPKGEVRFASDTLTSPFIDTVDFLINYYEVPPDR